MNEKMARIGLKVKLIKINKTDELHGSCPTMHKMIQKNFTISEVFRASCSNVVKETIQIRFLEDQAEYIWDPDDVEPLNFSKIKPKGGKFDPSNLMY